MSKKSIEEWMLELHKEKGKLRFRDIIDNYVSYAGEHPNGAKKTSLVIRYQKLIRDKKLIFDSSDGKSYLPN